MKAVFALALLCTTLPLVASANEAPARREAQSQRPTLGFNPNAQGIGMNPWAQPPQREPSAAPAQEASNQEWTCAEDVQCQNDKIDAVSGESDN